MEEQLCRASASTRRNKDGERGDAHTERQRAGDRRNGRIRQRQREGQDKIGELSVICHHVNRLRELCSGFLFISCTPQSMRHSHYTQISQTGPT